jgi:general secretion pathway protein A
MRNSTGVCCRKRGRETVVVIDEAQNLDASVLETVRLLSDFETPKAKLMHIILAGQPELADKLASPGLAQLRQRVSIMHGLEPLPAWEIKSYIEHRLKIAGYEGEPLFTPDAYEALSDFTEGIPRNVNNFCFNALSLAYGLQKKIVDMDIVKEVISDLDISRLTTTKGRARVAPAPEPEPEPVPEPEVLPTHPISGPAAAKREREEILSPAEAAAYMQEVALKLKNWQRSLDQSLSGVERSPRFRVDEEK